jgi:hypothetical protein
MQDHVVPVSGVYDATSPFIEVVRSNLPQLYAKLDIKNPKLL